MSKRVLIVDDAVVMRMMIKGILSKNGFEVVGEAENGADAFIDLLRDVHAFDVSRLRKGPLA